MRLLIKLGFLFICSLSTTTKHQKYRRSLRLSYDYGVTESLFKRRQISTNIVTTGSPSGQELNGTMPIRREIRDLAQDEDMWTLYILALDRLQSMDQSDKLSYYSIAGLWDIVIQYPAGAIRDRYYKSAANFKIPYWDWAAYRPAGDNIMPENIVGSPTINVNGPQGRQLIANPLFTYKFQSLSSSKFPNSPTLRYPDRNDSSAVSRDFMAVQNVENSATSIRSRIYNILTNYHNYLAFSNEGYREDSSPSEQDSLEAIHDQMHAIIGGGGHMSYIDYAGFDPVFFLHHAMVDRCFALWQVLNPNSYVIPMVAAFSTFTIPAGQIQDTNTPLTPFFKDTSGQFWNSADVRDIKNLGYSYPELSGISGDDITQDVIIAINRLYGHTGERIIKRDLDAQSISASGKYREWVANIKMQKSALNEPYSVYIFLGPFSDDPMCWSSDPNLAGSHTTFSRNMSPDEIVLQSSSQMVTASIPLTDALIGKIGDGELESLNVEDVSSWLLTNLSYRISLLNGQEICVEEVPTLEISIASAEVKLPENHIDMPVWGQMTQHIQVNIE